MAKTVYIGCRLPHGLILDHPLNPAHKVTIDGLNRARIIGATFATTEVDAEFWEAWKTANSGYAPLMSGALFEAKSAADVAAKAKEVEKEKTGFEAMPQDAEGVKPASKD